MEDGVLVFQDQSIEGFTAALCCELDVSSVCVLCCWDSVGRFRAGSAAFSAFCSDAGHIK